MINTLVFETLIYSDLLFQKQIYVGFVITVRKHILHCYTTLNMNVERYRSTHVTYAHIHHFGTIVINDIWQRNTMCNIY